MFTLSNENQKTCVTFVLLCSLYDLIAMFVNKKKNDCFYIETIIPSIGT